jgi:hypothetical protein
VAVRLLYRIFVAVLDWLVLLGRVCCCDQVGGFGSLIMPGLVER